MLTITPMEPLVSTDLSFDRNTGGKKSQIKGPSESNL